MFVVPTTRRRLLVAVLLVVLGFAMIGAVPVHEIFPAVILLPNGFQPEGIASGSGNTFYVGSISTGAIYRGDLRSGKGAILVPAQAGRSALGIKYDRRIGALFVAGGQTGYAYVYDAKTGANIAAVQLTTLPSLINDEVITKDAVYFTNSSQPTLYRLPLVHTGGLHPASAAQAIPLSGDYKFTPGAINANGIVATADGKALIIVNTAEGALYKVDPTSGDATRIDLGGGSVVDGDGLLLDGNILYVVQNQLNKIAVVRLNFASSAGAIVDNDVSSLFRVPTAVAHTDFISGTILSTITSSLFHVPTTIAGFGDALYVVNARFGTPPTPNTEYEVVRVPQAQKAQ